MSRFFCVLMWRGAEVRSPFDLDLITEGKLAEASGFRVGHHPQIFQVNHDSVPFLYDC